MCTPFFDCFSRGMRKGGRVCVFSLTRWMNPAAVSHVLMKMEHRFTSLMELLWETRVTSHLSKWNASHWRTDQSVIYWAQHTHERAASSRALPLRCSLGVNTQVISKQIRRQWDPEDDQRIPKEAFTLLVSTLRRVRRGLHAVAVCFAWR